MNYTMPAQDTFDVGTTAPPTPEQTDLARAYVRRRLGAAVEDVLAMLGLTA